MEKVWIALISALGTASAAVLVYLRAKRHDTFRHRETTEKVATERERSLSEGWATFATHMEEQLRATQEDLSSVRIQLVACQKEARDAHDEAYVARRLIASLEDELASVRKRVNHLEQ